jgi:hypothetical protein
VHNIRFDIQIVDGVVGGTGWSDRLTEGGLTNGGMSVVLSACVAVLSSFSVRRGHLGRCPARRMIAYSHGHLTLALTVSQPRYVYAIIGLIVPVKMSS